MKSYISQTGGVGAGFDDKNNCTCRALANAVDWTIEEATTYMKEFGRVKNRGIFVKQFAPAYKLTEFNKTTIFGSTTTQRGSWWYDQVGGERAKGTTLGNLLKQPKYKQGTHIVIITGHALCIKEGKPVDVEGSFINPNKVVKMTFSK